LHAPTKSKSSNWLLAAYGNYLTTGGDGQAQPQPGMQLACDNPDCFSPGLNDERRATAPKSPILVCIESVCGLRQSLDATMLTCVGNDNCFAPDNQAEQTTTR
jgi:hypothetical protein